MHVDFEVFWKSTKTPFLKAPLVSGVPLPGTCRGSMLARNWASMQSVVRGPEEVVVAPVRLDAGVVLVVPVRLDVAAEDGGVDVEVSGTVAAELAVVDDEAPDGRELDVQAANAGKPTVITIAAIAMRFIVLPPAESWGSALLTRRGGYPLHSSAITKLTPDQHEHSVQRPPV